MPPSEVARTNRPQPGRHGHGAGLAAPNPHRQHAAEPAPHLAAGDVMAPMSGQTRVQHGVDAPVGGEGLGDSEGAGRALPHPGKQGPHSSKEEPRVEASRYGAGAAAPGPDALHERVIDPGHHRPGEDVAVPVQVLGGGMDHQVGAEIDRTGMDGRGHRAVGHQAGAGAGGRCRRRRSGR